MDSEKVREILRDKLIHAFIGGLAAIALVSFHQKLEEATGLGEVAFLLLVLVAAFLFLAGLEVFLEWFWTLFKIEIPGVGKIDGVWLHARYAANTGKIIGGSVIHIRTVSPKGFHVHGKSYRLDGSYDGSFHGRGEFNGINGFGYIYRGDQDRGQDASRAGSGVGQYFYKKPHQDQLVDGRFTAHGLTQTQIVRGKRHGKRIDEQGQAAILNEYLTRAPQSVTPSA